MLWNPLGEAGVYRDTTIGIDGLSGLRVSQCLELLLLSLSAGASAKLGYIVDKGVVTISTRDSLPAPRPVAHLYDGRRVGRACASRPGLPSRGSRGSRLPSCLLKEL